MTQRQGTNQDSSKTDRRGADAERNGRAKAAERGPRKNGTRTANGRAERPTQRRTLMRVPTHDEIMARAYEIYLERGRAPGDPDADWAQAERELIARALRDG